MEIRRLATAALTGVAASALLAGSAGAAGSASTGALADPPDTPAAHGAAWLETQLVGGDHLETVFGSDSFPDAGLTIDGIFAFAAANADRDAAEAAVAWLEDPDNLGVYVGDGTDESYAGALGKAAVAAEVAGIDPAAFGGVDLVGRLLARQSGSGRFEDASSFGDFSNTIGQAFGIIALVRDADPAHTTQLASAVAYLAGQQCPDGGFPIQLEQATCTSGIDATAFAAQALAAAGSPAAGDALDHLASQRHADGGFGDDAATTNANSTGVVAAAFAAGGRSSELATTQDALVDLQVAECGLDPAHRGAVLFDASGFDGRAVRATTQAVPGLAGQSLAVISLSGDAPGAAAPTPRCTIDDLYEDFLGRAGDPGGMAFWQPLIASNPGAAAVVARGLETSVEGSRRIVDGAYEDLLGRSADGSGLGFFAPQVQGTSLVEPLLVALAASGEYRTGHAGTDAGVVTGWYDDFLHRAPDAGGLAFFVGRLGAGVPASTLVGQLLATAEAERVWIDDDYQRLLGRSADAGGLDAWQPFVHVAGRLALDWNLAGSAEYAEP